MARGTNWTIEETTALIECWEAVEDEFCGTYRNKHVYEKVAKALWDRGFVERTWETCRTKIKTLRQSYLKAREQYHAPGQTISSFPFYDKLHDFLGSKLLKTEPSFDVDSGDAYTGDEEPWVWRVFPHREITLDPSQMNKELPVRETTALNRKGKKRSISETLDDFDWEPNEAERKLRQARRDRSDKISKIMGDYLLKGYKMLATSCDECSTILLEDKSGMKYCIACKELDTDTEKDNPVTSAVAARSLVQEGAGITNGKSAIPQFNRLDLYSSPSGGEPPSVTMAMQSDQSLSEASIKPSHGLSPEMQLEAVSTLCNKISWACEQLRVSTSVDYCINLCNLIKASTDALQSLKVYSLSVQKG